MRVLSVAALLVGLVFAIDCGPDYIANRADEGQPRSAQDPDTWPPVMVWAWQRPADLTFIDPHRVGVALLVKTIYLRGNGELTQPNVNGVRVPSGTWVMACARIETDSDHPPVLSSQQARDVAVKLASLARYPDAKAVQIDFDATTSQRSFYRDLLIELRRQLPRAVPLSITALASWCTGGDWIGQLPVSEAVPMLFQMGPDRTSMLLRLESHEDFPELLCRKSVGTSTDESMPWLPAGRRLYIFNREVWTKDSFDKVMASNK
jgi:hypothetical protein